MPRRVRTDVYDYSLGALSWLFAVLLVTSVIAGLFSELMH